MRPIRSDLSAESVEDLARSIQKVGVIEPLIVEKDGDKYRVIAGHRRLLASEIAGLALVPAEIVEVDDEKRDLIMLHENMHRRSVDPEDQAHFFNYLMEKYQIDLNKLVEMLGFSESYIRARLRILEYPDYLREALMTNEISFGVANELFLIEDDEERKRYAQYAIKHGVTTAVARTWKNEWKESLKAWTPSEVDAERQAQQQHPERWTVDCAICGERLEMRHAKLIPAHPDCAAQIQQ
jgi:ParB family chromosome partitioning protein